MVLWIDSVRWRHLWTGDNVWISLMPHRDTTSHLIPGRAVSEDDFDRHTRRTHWVWRHGLRHDSCRWRCNDRYRQQCRCGVCLVEQPGTVMATPLEQQVGIEAVLLCQARYRHAGFACLLRQAALELEAQPAPSPPVYTPNPGDVRHIEPTRPWPR